jgi:hypothetical protein
VVGLPFVTPDQIEQVLPRLEQFAAEAFADFARADRREKGTLYMRGLMTDGARRSMQPMAVRLGIDHQRLQQFITPSTWDYTAVRRRLAIRMGAEIKPEAYAIDDVGFPKDGAESPAVAAQYSGALGKVGNCQIAVSVQMVTDTHPGPGVLHRPAPRPKSPCAGLTVYHALREPQTLLALWTSACPTRTRTLSLDDLHTTHHTPTQHS